MRQIIKSQISMMTFVGFLMLFGFSVEAQECDLTVQTTPVTCYGGTDGEAKLLLNGNLISFGNSTKCPNILTTHLCSQQVVGSREFSANTGALVVGDNETVYLTGADYNGSLTIGSGTLVICGKATFSSITYTNPESAASIVVNGELSLAEDNIVIPSTITLKNYGKLNFVTATINGAFENNGELVVTGNLSVNSQEKTVTNNHLINIGGALQLNVGTSMTNNCTLVVNGAYMHNGDKMYNNGDIIASGGVNINAGFYLAGSSSSLTTPSLYTNAVINGVGEACSSFKVTGSATLGYSGQIIGNIDFCMTGALQNLGTIGTGVTTDCSCNTSLTSETINSETDIIWNLSTVENGHTVTSLSSGDYSVGVSLEGCDVTTIPFTITSPDELVASVSLNGTIAMVNVVGGNTGAYRYVWSDGLIMQSGVRDLSNQQSGEYCVVVEDSKGCKSASSCVTIQTDVTDGEHCDFEVKTTSPTCHGGTDGSAEIWLDGELLEFDVTNTCDGQTCAIADESPYNCSSSLSNDIIYSSNTGEVIIVNGQTTYLTSSNFLGNVRIGTGGGKLVVCGSAIFSTIEIEDDQAVFELYNNNRTEIKGSSIIVTSNMSFHNYGTLQMNVDAITWNGGLDNHGRLEIAGSMTLNADHSIITNKDKITIAGALAVNASMPWSNEGILDIKGSVAINGIGAFTNTCTVHVGGAYGQNCRVYNNGLITVLGNTALYSGGYFAGAGSLLDLQGAQVNTSLNGVGQSCGSVSFKSSTVINPGVIVDGNLSLCTPISGFVNWGAISSSVSTDCSCQVSGTSTGTAQTSGNGTIEWSSGTSCSGGTKVHDLVVGTHTVTIKVPGCTDTTITVVIEEVPVIQISVSLTDNIATVTASGGNGAPYKFVWNDGVNLTTPTRIFETEKSGTYCVTIEDSKGCLSNTQACVTYKDGTTVVIKDPCEISIDYVSQSLIVIDEVCEDCNWKVKQKDGTLGNLPYTIAVPCKDSLVTLENCDGIVTTLTIKGNGLACNTGGNCPDPTNPLCEENSCPNPENPACCTGTACCVNTQSFMYNELDEGTIQLHSLEGSGNYYTYNTYNNDHDLLIEGLPNGTYSVTVLDVESGDQSCLEITVTKGNITTKGTTTVISTTGCMYKISDQYTTASGIEEVFASTVSYYWINPVNNEVLSITQSYDIGSKPLFGKPSYLKVEVVGASGAIIATNNFTIPFECYPTDCHPNDPNCPKDDKTKTLTINYTATAEKCGTPSVVQLTVTGGINNTYRTSNNENDGTGLRIENLSVGTHLITVYDVTAQKSQSKYVTVPANEKSDISLINGVDPLVGLNSTYEINITDDHSTGPYTINFNGISPYYKSGVNINSTNSLGIYSIPSDQGNGSFPISVTDANCNKTSFDIYRRIIQCPDNVSFVASVQGQNPSTNTILDGTVQLNNLPNGAEAIWTGGTIEGNRKGSLINGLGAGEYSVLVKDKAGDCVLGAPVKVVLCTPFSNVSVVSTSEGDCNLSVQAVVHDKLGNASTLTNVNYIWVNPFNGNSVATETSVDLKSITLVGNPTWLKVKVKQGTKFVGSATIVIPVECRHTEICQQASLSYTPINPACEGGANGSVKINQTSAGYVTWINTPTSETYSWERKNLSAGDYEVLLHVNGCSSPVPFIIGLNEPTRMVLELEKLLDPGHLQINVTNGMSPYTYKWDDVEDIQTINTRTDLEAGTEYTVTVADKNNCTEELTFTYDPCGANPPNPYVLYDDISKEATAIANGGVGPYVYSWVLGTSTNSSEGKVKSDLELNSLYTLTVTDAQGCQGVVTYNHPGCGDLKDNVSVITTNATNKKTCNGTATLDFSSLSNQPNFDLSEYIVLWDKVDILNELETATVITPFESESRVRISNVCSGEHEVFIFKQGTDACALKDEFTVGSEETYTEVDCDDSPLIITPKDNVVDYTKKCANEQVDILFSVSGGQKPYKFTWKYTDENDNERTFVSDKPGYTNAPSGVYTLSVEEKAGCSTKTSFTVTGGLEQLTVSQVPTPPICASAKGSVVVEPSKGKAPYTVEWGDNTTGETRADLVQGVTYDYAVIDAAGCTVNMEVTIDKVPYRTSYREEDTIKLCTGRSIFLTALYMEDYEIAWSTNALDENNNAVIISTPAVSMLKVETPGLYTLTRTHKEVTACPSVVETVFIKDKTDCDDDELPCHNYSYTLPVIETEDACEATARITAKANATQLFEEYIVATKRDFTNEYITNVMGSLKESLTIQYSEKEQQYTLYYYDQAGNLVRTVPPEGVTPLDKTQTASVEGYWNGDALEQPSIHTEHTYATTYTYNSLNQLVSQDVPDNEQQKVWDANAIDAIGETVTTLDADGNNVFLFANTSDQTVLYRSTDGGNGYTKGLQLSLGDINDLQQVGGNSTTFYAVGTKGLIMKAVSGPVSWISVPSPTITELIKVHFIDANKGYVINKEGMIWYTANGGTTWATVTTSTRYKNQSEGTLVTALEGMTISDIKVLDKRLYITGSSLNNSRVFRSDADVTYSGAVLAFTGLNTVVENFEAVAYSGSQLHVLSGGKYRFTKIGSALHYENVYQGIEGAIQEYEIIGTLHVVKTNTGVYGSDDGKVFTKYEGISGNAKLIKQGGKIVFVDGTNAYKLDNGVLTELLTDNKVLLDYFSTNTAEYVLLGDNTIKNLTENVTIDLGQQTIYGATKLSVDNNRILIAASSGIESLVFDQDNTSWNKGVVVSGTYTDFQQQGTTLYVRSGNNLREITTTTTVITEVVTSTTSIEKVIPVVTVSGTITATLPNESSVKEFAQGTTVTDYSYIGYSNSNQFTVVSGANQETINALEGVKLYETAKGTGTNVFTTSTNGMILKHKATWGATMVFGAANESYTFTEATTNNAKLNVVSSDNKVYEVGESDLSLIELFVSVNPIIEISGEKALDNTGDILTNNGTLEETLSGYSTLNTSGTIDLAGGTATKISYRSAGEWKAIDAIKVAPIRATAVDGTRVIAVGDEGTIISSTATQTSEKGDEFIKIYINTSNSLTSVTLTKTGFVVGDDKGNLYISTSGGTPSLVTVAD